jgi:hypothetical protein
MPISLYDMMRPVAIAAGLGAGCAGQRGASLVIGGLLGLATGAVAFLVVGRALKSWFARHAAQPSAVAGGTHEQTAVAEGAFGAVYIAVFVILLVATLAGTYFGRWLVHEVSF